MDDTVPAFDQRILPKLRRISDTRGPFQPSQEQVARDPSAGDVGSHGTARRARDRKVLHVLSVIEEGIREAHRHKWIESQKRGCDLGDEGLQDWYRRYWPIFCRLKCLEHLEGSQSFMEFELADFGLLQELYERDAKLIEMILDRAYDGMENLNIICWAQDWGLPMERILWILERLNLNRAQHLDPDFPPRFARKDSLKLPVR
jgi:hypothetical protein